MQTIKIDILSQKAIELLQDLESQQLIRFHKDDKQSNGVNWAQKYKGALSKQNPKDIDHQLDQLRQGWE